MKDHYTIQLPSEKELIVNKSQFICRVYPAETEEEIHNILSAIRKEHYKATHHCYAYVLGEDKSTMKFFDDGEPSGTAGKPILSVLEHHDLTNILAVVIRYFGGVKLGAGGLVRAYSQSTADSLSNAQIIKKQVCDIVRFKSDYTFYGKLQVYLSAQGLTVKNSEFSDEITVDIYSPTSFSDKFITDIVELSNGNYKGELFGQVYLDIKV